MMKTPAQIFKAAPFPAVMTILSFVLFIGVYGFLTVKSIEPFYFQGLLFAIPFVCFGFITYLAVSGKLKPVVANAVTGVLILVFGIASQVALVWISFEAARTVTTDIAKYERVLKLNDYPNNRLIQSFPNPIPTGAKNIRFRYNPACLQGGENFELKFEADSVQKYYDELPQEAKWIGKSTDSEAKRYGIRTEQFKILGYEELPDDFTIYVFYSEPYHPDSWNHGKLSLAAVSKQRREVLFYAEDW